MGVVPGVGLELQGAIGASGKGKAGAASAIAAGQRGGAASAGRIVEDTEDSIVEGSFPRRRGAARQVSQGRGLKRRAGDQDLRAGGNGQIQSFVVHE